MKKVYVVSALRTPVGILDGNLKSLSEQQLCAACMEKVFDNAGIGSYTADEIIIGCAKQTSVPSNLAKHAALMTKIPETVPAYTVHRQSASGLQAVANGFWLIKSGLANIAAAGGVESMSNIPREIHNARYEFNENTKIVFDPIAAQLEGAQPPETYGKLTGKIISQNISKLYGFDESELLDYALMSLEKAKARSSNDHILPLEVKKGKKVETVNADEFYEFPNTIAPVADAAAVCLLADEETVNKLKLPVLAEIVSVGFSAGDPGGKGLIGERAVALALKKAETDINRIGLIECNEMFAAQSLALKKELKKMGLLNSDKIFNSEGGALATGSAWGACGAVMTVDLLNRMKSSDTAAGIVVTPAEGGQAMAAVFKKGSVK